MILTLVLQALEGAKAHDDELDVDPVSLDLYVVVVMMALSILFLWETGKHCLRWCCSRRPDEDIRVSMIRDDADIERRSRRQEAVRRAIERETGELRLRRSSSQSTEGLGLPAEDEVPRTSLDVTVHLSSPTPAVRITTALRQFLSLKALPLSARHTMWTVLRTPVHPPLINRHV